MFVPSAFITGISGQFYRQFALTIAGATIISLIVSLTLSPALCAMLLKPHSRKPQHGLVHVAAASLLPRLQLELRQALARVCLVRRAHRAHRGGDAAYLCRRHRLRHERVPQDPDRLHSGGGRRISHYRHAAAACRIAGANRRSQPPGGRAGARSPRRRARREHRRLFGRHAHQRSECRRRLRRPEGFRGARQGSPSVCAGDPTGFVRQVLNHPRRADLRRRAASGARHRQRRRFPHDGSGPRRARARPRFSRWSAR